jgi:hypothetical protein
LLSLVLAERCVDYDAKTNRVWDKLGIESLSEIGFFEIHTTDAFDFVRHLQCSLSTFSTRISKEIILSWYCTNTSISPTRYVRIYYIIRLMNSSIVCRGWHQRILVPTMMSIVVNSRIPVTPGPEAIVVNTVPISVRHSRSRKTLCVLVGINGSLYQP